MITVRDFLDLIDHCDHDIVIYDDNVVGDDSDNFGDILWANDTGKLLPGDVGDLEIVSFDLEERLLRIWANGDGIPNKYYYTGWNK